MTWVQRAGSANRTSPPRGKLADGRLLSWALAGGSRYAHSFRDLSPMNLICALKEPLLHQPDVAGLRPVGVLYVVAHHVAARR